MDTDANGNEVIESHLTNASTIASANPDKGKVHGSTYGNNSAGNGQDAMPGESWTQQSIRWRENFPGGHAPQRPGAWKATVASPTMVARNFIHNLPSIGDLWGPLL